MTKKIPADARSHKFKFWRFLVYLTIICDDDRHNTWGYPFWYVRLPRWFKKKGRFGFAWGVVLSRSFEITFFTDKNMMKKL